MITKSTTAKVAIAAECGRRLASGGPNDDECIGFVMAVGFLQCEQ